MVQATGALDGAQTRGRNKKTGMINGSPRLPAAGFSIHSLLAIPETRSRKPALRRRGALGVVIVFLLLPAQGPAAGRSLGGADRATHWRGRAVTYSC